MDMLDNDDNKLTSLEDFEFICRICCSKRNDLRLFQENYLLDVFQAITNVYVFSNIDYPRNICNGCINELEDISLLIDILKYNDASCGKKTKNEMIRCKNEIESGILHEYKGASENNDDMSLQGSPICRICFSSSSSLTSFGEKTHLVHLFQNITNIDMKPQANSSEMTCICCKCINRLEKISSFISSSQLYEQKLAIAVNRNEAAKIQSYPDPIHIKLPTHEKLERKYEIDNNEAMNWNICTDETFVDESSVKLEIIDIKEEVIDRELVAFTEQCSQKGLKLLNKISSEETHFDGSILKEELEEFSLSPHIQDHDDEDVTAQNGKQLIECNWCEMRFTQKSTSQQHSLSHTGERPFRCNCCDKSFSRKSHVKQHMLTHTGEKQFKCDCCDKSFTTRSLAKRHMLTHTGEKPLKCDGCEKRFARKSDLQQHMIIHTGKKPFKCECCEKSFALKSTLRQHRLIHAREKRFKCDGCEKRFNRKTTLRLHMFTHTGGEPFKCDFCEKSFAQKSNLKQHMLTHSGEKHFKCDGCEKSFSLKFTLQRHMLSHTRQTTFTCDGCEKSFTHKSLLQQHMLTHTEGNPFRCNSCEKNFTRKSTLREHMFTHTGRERFKCDSCEKSFTRKRSLKRHMLTHTREMHFECDSCEKSFIQKSTSKQQIVYAVN